MASPSTSPKGRGTGNRRFTIHPPTTRELVLGWCLWLLGSWGATLWIDTTAPALRWMIFAAAFGLLIIWPVVRLSQDTHSAARRARRFLGRRVPFHLTTAFMPWLVLRDWLCLIFVFQAVIWPLRATGQWQFTQALWLDAGVAAWSLLAALVIAWGCRSPRQGDRVMAMLAVVLILIGEPLAQVFVNVGAEAGYWPMCIWRMRVSPLQTLWELTGAADPVEWTGHPWSATILSVAAAAAIGWFVLLTQTRRLAKRRPRGPQSPSPQAADR